MSDRVRIPVLLFGPAREIVGAERAAVEIVSPGTAGAVIDALIERHPDLAPLVTRSRIVVNYVYVDPDVAVGSDDEVAIIPPVGGG